MVRLKDIKPFYSSPKPSRFNSTMVRLKVRGITQEAVGQYLFQFHNGSIKRGGLEWIPTWWKRFQFHNGSIKSQTVTITCEVTLPFQFHNGSIKRKSDGSGRRAGAEFQFHNGSIKSPLFDHYESDEVCFNSTMVRLKGDGVRFKLNEQYMFQFHNGSIKREIGRGRNIVFMDVSIPQWFD